jgi:hypothetical protein
MGGSIEGQVVSVADKLAGLAFTHEQLLMGNHFMEPIYRRFVGIIDTVPYDWWPLVRDRVAAGLMNQPPLQTPDVGVSRG